MEVSAGQVSHPLVSCSASDPDPDPSPDPQKYADLRIGRRGKISTKTAKKNFLLSTPKSDLLKKGPDPHQN